MSIAELVLPLVNASLLLDLEFNYLSNPHLVVELLLVVIVTALLAGAYPAFAVSAFSPVHALKGGIASGKTGKLRTILVGAQFTFAIALMVLAGVTYQQAIHSKNFDIGFNSQNIVIIGTDASKIVPIYKSFRQELLSHPEITEVSGSQHFPIMGRVGYYYREDKGRENKIGLLHNTVDYGLLQLLDTKLIAGRYFSRDYAADRTVFPDLRVPYKDHLAAGLAVSMDGGAAILTESGVSNFGFDSPDQAIGQTVVSTAGTEDDLRSCRLKVVGVIEDIYPFAMFADVKPDIYALDTNWLSGLVVKMTGEKIPATLEFIDQTWRSFRPDSPIHRFFMDDHFEEMYQSWLREVWLFTILAGIAVFIACMGLFAMAAHTVQRRTKEIGIRKAVGASVRDIVRLMLWSFSKPVLVAIVIAWLLAYLAALGFLSFLASPAPISIVNFILSGVLALLIAWTTVFVHAWTAANTNPVNALRYE
jgi:putative ABC transport system permease protein